MWHVEGEGDGGEEMNLSQINLFIVEKNCQEIVQVVCGCVPVRLLTPQIIIPLRVQHEACSNYLLLSVGKLSTNIMD